MKHLDEYRDGVLAQQMAREIQRTATRPWNVMELCGGQTHSIVKFGIDQMLPCGLALIHGPGCPVCVTPLEKIDQAIQIAQRPEVILTSFGDMLRVPGSQTDLLQAKARGADVRIVYSPLDALKIAREHPAREVVFFAVGFETTAPATAMAVFQALQHGLVNFSMLVSHVLVPPAMEALLASPSCQVHGFLAAGHVCTVMGWEEYIPIARSRRTPIVVTGFEPVDILQGLLMVVRQLEQGRAEVENQYSRSVRREGNKPAQDLIRRVFRVVHRRWRGLGEIPSSGLGLNAEFSAFDAEKKFCLNAARTDEPVDCIAGLVLQGSKKPRECAAFGTRCTPEHPLGAPMVSGEGACAAYYHYRGQQVGA